jgi:hypothetical protein
MGGGEKGKGKGEGGRSRGRRERERAGGEGEGEGEEVNEELKQEKKGEGAGEKGTDLQGTVLKHPCEEDVASQEESKRKCSRSKVFQEEKSLVQCCSQGLDVLWSQMTQPQGYLPRRRIRAVNLFPGF